MQTNSTLTRFRVFILQTLVLIFLFSGMIGKINAQPYINGSLSTGATALNGTAAPAGYTWSECQNTTGNNTVANQTAGNSASLAGPFSIADDFTVPAGQTWNISKITVYGYVTGAAATPSPFTTLRIRIHQGNPLLGPTVIVFGDLTTNRLTASNDALMYRIFNTIIPATATGTTRKIWTLEANIATSLPAGTYWLEYQVNAGFMPLSSPVGVRTLPGYNAIQNTGTWVTMTDIGITPAGVAANIPVNVDMPFRIDYTTGAACTGTAPTASVLSQVGVTPPTVLINEGFDIAVPLPANWASKNNSTTVGTTGWFQGNATVFASHSGAATSYIGANFNNTTGANTISNWLMTPNITLTNGDVFTFWTRTTTGTFPDRLQVRQSTNGNSINCGTLPTDVGDFTTLLLDINPTLTATGYPLVWTQYTVTIAGLAAPTSGRLAFRYFVTNGGPAGANSDYIGIDDVLYSVPGTNPPPICSGTSTNLKVTITGGTSPYSVVLNANPPGGVPGNFTINNYVSGTNISVSPTATTTYSIVSVTATGGCVGTGNSGTPTVNVVACNSCIAPASATICAGQIQQLQTLGSGGSTTQTFTSTTPITIPATGTGSAAGDPANPYPSTISVTGLPTTGVTVKSITINGITHTFPDDIDAIVQSPTLVNVIMMSDVGGTTAATGINYTFDDAALVSLTTGSSPSGTYKPTNSGTPDAWVAPGPGSITQATPLISSFTGDPNGTWKLFVVDDAGGDVGTMSGWSITFNVPSTGGGPAVWTNLTNPTYTNMFLDNLAQNAYTGQSVTTVYVKPTVTSTFKATFATGPCAATTNTIVVTVNPLPNVGVGPNNQCAPVTLTATGANTYSWTPATGLSATTGATVTANPTVNTVYTVTGTNTATGCSNTATATVNYTPLPPTVTPNPASACLGTPLALVATTPGVGSSTLTVSSGPITVAIPDNSATGAFSVLPVNTLPVGAIITGISVTLNMTHTWDGDMVFNLKGANNNILNLDYYLHTTGGTAATTGFVNTTFSSTAVGFINAGTAPYTGNFAPDANLNGGGGFPIAGPAAYPSNITLFSGLYSQGNGNWTLAMADGGPADLGTLTSWSITFTYSQPVNVNAIWSPVTNLYTNSLGTIPYVAGTPLNTVYTSTPVNTTYTAVINTGTCSSGATTVPVTVNIPISITTQPVNATVCTDKVTSFTITVAGTTPSHNWQVKPTGSNVWTNIVNDPNYSGANTNTLTITAPPNAWNGYQYRDSITGAAPCAFRLSNVVTLTVNPLPTVVLSASPYYRLFPGLRTTLSVASTPAAATYAWFKNGSPFTGSTSATYVADVDAMGDYYVRVTDVNGCVNTSNTVSILDSVSGRVFIYPSPNNGRFQVRFYSIPGNSLPRGITVYDAKGARIMTQTFSVGRPYDRMDVDLGNVSDGIYWVELGDMNGKRLAVGRVLVKR